RTLLGGVKDSLDPAWPGGGSVAIAGTEHGCGARGESDEQVILEADEDLGAALIALTAGAAKELAIHTSGGVTFSEDDMEPTDVGDAFGEFDIRPAPGHIRRHSHCAFGTRLADDLGFKLVVDGV